MTNLFNEIKNAYNYIIHREKIVNLNMMTTIEGNFDSCLSVFKGFFGEPYIDNDLFMCTKEAYGINKKKLTDANFITKRFGFRVVASKTCGGGCKIMMHPESGIQDYITSRSFNEEYQNKNELYNRIR